MTSKKTIGVIGIFVAFILILAAFLSGVFVTPSVAGYENEFMIIGFVVFLMVLMYITAKLKWRKS